MVAYQKFLISSNFQDYKIYDINNNYFKVEAFDKKKKFDFLVFDYDECKQTQNDELYIKIKINEIENDLKSNKIVICCLQTNKHDTINYDEFSLIS